LRGRFDKTNVRPTWDDLTLENVDMHFHAGTERPEAYTALDFLSFAVATGRRVIGVTDHFGRFLGESRKKLNHYDGTPAGFLAFAKDVRMAARHFPEAIILFGPEMGFPHMHTETAHRTFSDSESDFLLGEPSGKGEEDTFGEYLLEGMESMAEFSRAHRCPSTLAHPLRSIVNRYVGKTGPGPRMPGHEPFPPLASEEDPVGHVEELFDLDIASLARASRRRRIPLEINGSSWGRILGMNHRSFAERYLLFYHTFIQRGGTVILGSDLHNIEHGAPTPFVVALMLGIRPEEMTLLRHWVK